MDSTLELITLREPHCQVSETYRSLGANLLLKNGGKLFETILVTSAGYEDVRGNPHNLSETSLLHVKSVTLANLAIIFAQSGRKTLIVDGDLRSPWQHEIWKRPKEPGLDTFLAHRNKVSLCKTDVDDLWILPTGNPPTNPQTTYASTRMHDLLIDLKRQADVIIIDSSPIMTATETLFLSKLVEAVLLVINAGTSRTENVHQAMELLKEQNAKLIGAVLVNVPS